jgi:predicted component of type VI protein secretion system
MQNEKLEILVRAVREVEQTYAKLAPQLRAQERLLNEHFASLLPALQQMADMLASPSVQQALQAAKNTEAAAYSLIAARLSTPALLTLSPIVGQARVANVVLSTPAIQPAGTVIGSVHAPEEDPAALRAHLAEKDARIAELQAELREMRMARAFEGDPYTPPMDPSWFSDN